MPERKNISETIVKKPSIKEVSEALQEFGEKAPEITIIYMQAMRNGDKMTMERINDILLERFPWLY